MKKIEKMQEKYDFFPKALAEALEKMQKCKKNMFFFQKLWQKLWILAILLQKLLLKLQPKLRFFKLLRQILASVFSATS